MDLSRIYKSVKIIKFWIWSELHMIDTSQLFLTPNWSIYSMFIAAFCE